MSPKTLKYLRLFLATPVALLWDLLYNLITLIYKGATYVDEVGGKKLDKFINGDNS